MTFAPRKRPGSCPGARAARNPPGGFRVLRNHRFGVGRVRADPGRGRYRLGPRDQRSRHHEGAHINTTLNVTDSVTTTLLDHVVLQVDDLDAIGDWYDQIVSLAGGTRTFDMPNLIGYALPGQPTQLFFSLATDPGGRQTHLALRVEDEATVRRGHEFATARGAEILHEPRLWPEYGPDYYAVFIRDPAGNNLELKCQASTARPTLST